MVYSIEGFPDVQINPCHNFTRAKCFGTGKIVVGVLKRRLLKIAKSPVLSTGGNDTSKSRYGNDLKFVMAFLDRLLYAVGNGFSFN